MSVAREDVMRIVRLQLGHSHAREDQRLVEDLGAQRVDIDNLVSTVERKYNVHLSEAEITEIRTGGDLHALVDRHA